MAGNSNEPHRTVTSKTVAILLTLTMGQGHTLTTLARETTLPISTVYRLLRDLVDSTFVERGDDGTYRLGSPLRRMTPVTGPPTLTTRAPLIVDDLVDALKSTVRLGMVEEGQIAYITNEPGPRPGTLFPNCARLPLHATAMGKALLAFESSMLLQTVAAVGLARFTPRTITNLEALRHEVTRTRLQGFATSDRELHPTACAVGVPVLDLSGTPIAAIEVDVPDLRERTVGHVTPALSVAARALARQLSSGMLESAQGSPRRHAVHSSRR